MLNRTNQMLSANANALNLGMRSAAQTLGINMVQGSPRLRHAHLLPQEVDTVRTEISGMFGWPPISISAGYPIPEFSGSPRAKSRLTSSPEFAAKVIVAEAPPLVRPVVADEPVVRLGVAQAAAMPRSSEAGPRSSRAIKRGSAALRLRRPARAVRAGAAEATRMTLATRPLTVHCTVKGG